MRSSRVSLRAATTQVSVSGTPPSTSAWRTCQPTVVATASASGPGSEPSRRPACDSRCSKPSSASTSLCQSGDAPTSPASRRIRLARLPACASTRRAARSSHVEYFASAGSASPVRIRSSSHRSSSVSPANIRSTRSSRARSRSGAGQVPRAPVTAAPDLPSRLRRAGRCGCRRPALGPGLGVRRPAGGGRVSRLEPGRHPADGAVVSGTSPCTHSSSSASTCLHGWRRLGQVQRDATPT